jgi:hypothetical protein
MAEPPIEGARTSPRSTQDAGPVRAIDLALDLPQGRRDARPPRGASAGIFARAQ